MEMRNGNGVGESKRPRSLTEVRWDVVSWDEVRNEVRREMW